MNEEKNNLRKENKKKTLILSLIAIVTLSLVAIGAAYAFFASKNTGKKDVNINAESGTTDVLTFENGETIEITANMDNFASGMGSEEGKTIAKAKLTANDATNEASDSYYVYLKINTNELRYTNFKDESGDIKPGIEQEDKTITAPDGTHTTKVPELILTVKETNKATGETKELNQADIENLTYYDSISTKRKTEDSTEDVTISGFDITEAKGMILLKYENIHTSNDEKDEERENLPNMTTHEWEITVTLINLDSDQNNNTGKTFDATLILQKEEYQETIVEVLLAKDNQDGVVTLYKHNTEELTKLGIENATLSANDNSYRYSGSSEAVKNYVCLDGTSTQNDCNSDADLYRIIGLFPNESGEYEMKLIKYDYATKDELGDDETAPSGAYRGNLYLEDTYKGNNLASLAAYSWNSSKGNSMDDNNINMWQKSNLNKINLNQFYYNYMIDKISDLEGHINEHKWITGGCFVGDASKEVYNKELGAEKITTSDKSCYAEDDNRTAIECTDEDLTYQDQIGIMYVSDYGYAAYPKAWNISFGTDEYTQEGGVNNWMYMGLDEWTISRIDDCGYDAWEINFEGDVTDSYSRGVEAANGVRPVFYLDSSTKITSGDGSKTNPFRLSWN